MRSPLFPELVRDGFAGDCPPAPLSKYRGRLDVAGPGRKDIVIEKRGVRVRQTRGLGFGTMPAKSTRTERPADMLREARSERHEDVLRLDGEFRLPHVFKVEQTARCERRSPKKQVEGDWRRDYSCPAPTLLSGKRT